MLAIGCGAGVFLRLAADRGARVFGLDADRVDVSWAYEYPDDATLGRAMLAPAGAAVLVGSEREAELARRSSARWRRTVWATARTGWRTSSTS